MVDLQEADYVTYNLTRKILSVESAEEFQSVVNNRGLGGGAGEEGSAQKQLTFVYNSLNGLEVELVPGGREMTVE